jgi:tRNA (guanine37-N1)-methyltransferase
LRAVELAGSGRDIVLLCGRYEGVDERIHQTRVDEEISLGDFVLTGGELAALAVVDSIVRLLPGVLGNEASAPDDSFTTGLLEAPHYTRPEVFEGLRVPPVLLSGNHGAIAAWRLEEARRLTGERRPDLLAVWEALHPPPTPKRRRRARKRNTP